MAIRADFALRSARPNQIRKSLKRVILQQRIATRYTHPHAVGIVDEASFVKKGTHTAVQASPRARDHQGVKFFISNAPI